MSESRKKRKGEPTAEAKTSSHMESQGAAKKSKKRAMKDKEAPASEEQDQSPASASAALFSSPQAIAAAEKEILASPAKANTVLDLLNTLEHSAQPALQEASMQALLRIFVFYDAFGKRLTEDLESLPAKEQLRIWLHEQYLEFLKALLATLSAAPPLQIIALHALMQCVKQEAASVRPYRFPNTLLQRVVRALVDGALDREATLHEFNVRFMVHDDIRYYTLKSLAKILPAFQAVDSDNNQNFFNNVFMILHHLRFPPPEPIQDFLTAPPKSHPLRLLDTHRETFSECWMAFLRCQLPEEILLAVLENLNDDIMPHLQQPKLIIDFLTDAYNTEGAMPILALHGLFTLIYKHNLDYPDFFPKLYALLQPDVLFSRHRARFFALASLFLTSTHLPTYLVAAFAKRISRLMLTAPPAGAVLLSRLLYNLVRRHPSCKALIHRTSGEKLECDPFLADEPDPARCRAVESSVWETQSITRHYHPEVSAAPDALRTPALNRREFEIDKTARMSYATMLQKELKKPLGDEPPALVFTPAAGLVGPKDVGSDLWQW